MAQRRPRLTPLSVNQRLLDETLRHRIRLEQLAYGLARRFALGLDRGALEQVLGIVASSLARLKSRGTPVGGRRSPLRTKTLAELHKRSGEVLQRSLDVIQKELRAELRDLARSEGVWMRGAVNSSLPADLPMRFEMRAPHGQTLRAVVDQVDVLGRPIPEWFRGISTSAATAVRARINQGLLVGESTDTIVRALRGRRANGFGDGLLAAPKHHVETIVRTSSTAVSAQARELTARENDDLIRGVKWVSILDARTSPQCAALDGREFRIGEGPRPPIHHRCRSDVTYITVSWEELDLPFEDTSPNLRASMNGYVPASESFPVWFARQPQSFQAEYLGPGKFRLYQRGLVPLDRFISRDLRPLTLRELEALEEGIRSGTRSAAPFVLPGQITKQ